MILLFNRSIVFEVLGDILLVTRVSNSGNLSTSRCISLKRQTKKSNRLIDWVAGFGMPVDEEDDDELILVWLSWYGKGHF